MNTFIKILFAGATLLSTTAFAGPNASGGVPETLFDHDRAAIATILANGDVISILRHKGSIQNISATSVRDVFVITTPKCQLAVQFVRTCTFDTGLPQCDYSSQVLPAQSSGACGR